MQELSIQCDIGNAAIGCVAATAAAQAIAGSKAAWVGMQQRRERTGQRASAAEAAGAANAAAERVSGDEGDRGPLNAGGPRHGPVRGRPDAAAAVGRCGVAQAPPLTRHQLLHFALVAVHL